MNWANKNFAPDAGGTTCPTDHRGQQSRRLFDCQLLSKERLRDGRRETGCRKDYLFPSPYRRHCAGSRFIHQHPVILYPDAQHILTAPKNTTKLESLLLIGYSPNRVALPYQILTVGLNIIVLILSVGLVCWLRSYYIDSIRLLFPQLETGSLWAAVSMGILLFLIVSVINILAVKRKVLSIWMHKS